MKTRRFLLIGLVILGAFKPAWAWICRTTCADYWEGKCIKERMECTDEPQAPTVSYGAIAYGGKSGAYGYSHGWSSQTKAERVAVENCSKHGDDCKAVVWFERKCGAVVVRSDSSAVYWGVGNSIAEAQKAAMDECTKDKGKQCTVKVFHCSK
jgi:hypothetical protein